MRRVRHALRLLSDLLLFAVVNRALWPLLLVTLLLVIAVVVVVGQTAAPLVYTLF